MPRLHWTALTICLSLTIGATGCGSDSPSTTSPGRSGLPTGSEPAKLDPTRFSSSIDNPWWPMRVGSRWTYRETGGGETLTIAVEVLDRTRTVDGVEARIVHDRATTTGGATVEDTFDWYAQDDAGNVWYLGEATREFEHGRVVSTEGSWEAGVNGGQAGVVVPARPRTGLAYREEYLKGEAEDRARVLSVDERATVPSGAYRGALLTRNDTPLEPDVMEYKWYARGVGPVLAITTSGGSDREELVAFESGQ